MRKRPPHVLQSNSVSTRPTRHLFVDVESHVTPQANGTEMHHLRLGWWCFWRRRTDRDKDTEDWGEFRTEAELWDVVSRYLKPKEPLYLVSHNVSYDFGVLHLFDNLPTLGLKLVSFYQGGFTTIATFRNGPVKLVLLDNGNFFPTSLRQLGIDLNFNKMDVDPLHATDEELSPYCRRDVEVMLHAWRELYAFMDEHDLGSWGKTLPSQAFRAYRHRFMHDYILIHNDEEALELERGAYHGGRTSAFFQGKLPPGQYYKLDVNSMYPFVMRSETYPRLLRGSVKRMGMSELSHTLDRYLAVAKVVVETSDPVYPVMHRGHLVHPTGQFQTTLTTPELQRALRRGEVKDVLAVAVYEGADLFSDYVNTFYALKLKYGAESNTSFRSMTKLYLNSLYGKFGQREQKWMPIEKLGLEDPGTMFYVNTENGQKLTLYRFGPEVWTCLLGGEAFNSFPAIAAHVTAHARTYLWELITRAGREHVFYCDTDSVVVDAEGKDALTSYLDDNRLGALKVEETASEVEVWAPKHYSLAGHWKRKGIPESATEVAQNTFRYQQFPSFLTQSHRSAQEPYRTEPVTKRMRLLLYDGVRQEDGRVRPWQYEELHSTTPYTRIPSEEEIRILAMIGALRETRPLDQTTILRLWDYRHGDWRTRRDKFGNLQPLEYSDADQLATELGYSDLEELKDAVLQTLRMNDQIGNLRRQLARVRQPQTDTSPDLPLPF